MEKGWKRRRKCCFSLINLWKIKVGLFVFNFICCKFCVLIICHKFAFKLSSIFLLKNQPQMTSIDVLFIKIQSNCFSIPVNAPLTPEPHFKRKTFKTISKLRFFSCHVQSWSTRRSLTWKIRRHQLDGNKWKATTSSADPHLIYEWESRSVSGRKHSRCGDGIVPKSGNYQWYFCRILFADTFSLNN